MRLGSQRFRFVLGLILLLAGLEIAVTLTYIARWIGAILMISGLGILLITARKTPGDQTGEKSVKPKSDESEGSLNLADRLLAKLTFNGRINPLFPIIGCALIVFVYIFNFTVRGNMDLGVNDTITVLLGACIALYNYIPKKFSRERDFVLLFLIFLFMILVLPLTLYSLVSGPIVENSNSPFIFYLLAKPTSDMLNFIGIPASAHSIPPSQIVNGIHLTTSGVPIVYKNMGSGHETPYSTVMIGISCTGLYSVSIFISGFIAFILIEYGKLDLRVASLLTLGIFTSWFANILRMTIIVAVGSNYGGEALKWTHENAGIFIFMLWVGLFWALMFKILVPKTQKSEDISSEDKDEDNEPTGEPSETSDQLYQRKYPLG